MLTATKATVTVLLAAAGKAFAVNVLIITAVVGSFRAATFPKMRKKAGIVPLTISSTSSNRKELLFYNSPCNYIYTVV